MKTIPLQKQPTFWQEMKTAAKTMWKWFTAAEKNQPDNLDLTLDEKEPSPNQLIQQETIKGTPFKVTGHQSKGYWITYGPYKLTEPRKTRHEATLDLQKEKWNIIARLVAATHDFEQNIKPTLENK